MPEPRYEITPICTPEDIQFAYAKARELLGLQNFKYAEYMTEHFEQVRATANLIMVEMGVKVEISPDSWGQGLGRLLQADADYLGGP